MTIDLSVTSVIVQPELNLVRLVVTPTFSSGLKEQLQSDWEQTDETAKDFIKNKPTIPTEKTKTSELINDGADGENPFISENDLPNFGDIVTHDVDEFATSEQGSKADTAYDHSQTTGNPHGNSVSDLSDVDGEATTVSTGDSFFLKVGNLWKSITESNFVTWLNTTFFTKTDSDRRFVAQNGGTIYHITRWFTPTSALTIASNGLSATITSGQFTAAMTGAKLRLTGCVNEPIITYVSANSITFSFAVDSAFFGQSVAVADWGIYERRVELNALKTDKIIPNSDTTGVVIRNAADTADVAFFDTVNVKLGIGGISSVADVKMSIYGGHYLFEKNYGLLCQTSSQGNIFILSVAPGNNPTIDFGYQSFGYNFYVGSNVFANIKTTGLRVGDNTNAETKLDVNGTTTLRDWVYLNNGTHTGDAVGDFREKVVSGVLVKDICRVNSATKGDTTAGNWSLVETSQLTSITDSNELIGAGSFIDLETGRSGRGSIVFGDGVGYADFIFTSAGVVTLIQYTSNVFTSVQTGTNHVIIKDNGTNVRIVNEMGSTMNFNVKIQYN